MNRGNHAGLFDNDPALIPRDSKGRFATPERAYADRAIDENKLLRTQVERYKRMYFASADLASHWQRKYEELHQKVKGLC